MSILLMFSFIFKLELEAPATMFKLTLFAKVTAAEPLLVAGDSPAPI
jgi:hypothetical protein